MKIILYPSANPDRHGKIGVVIEVDAAEGNRLVCEGIAMVVEHDKPPKSRPGAVLAREHLRREAELEDDETEPDTELDDKDDDHGEDEYQEETDEEV